MAYATQTDLEKHASLEALIQLTDRATPATGAPDAATIASALDAASDMVDSYLRARYATPLAPVPNAIQRYTVHIAYYLLYGDAQSYPEAVRTDYEDAIKRLKEFAQGIAVLASDAPAAPAGVSEGARIDAPERIFTRDAMAGF